MKAVERDKSHKMQGIDRVYTEKFNLKIWGYHLEEDIMYVEVRIQTLARIFYSNPSHLVGAKFQEVRKKLKT